jgi:thymidylate synthase
MHVHFRNVNDAFHGLVDHFVRGSTHEGRSWGDKRDKAPVVNDESRNGGVLRIDEPVTITYTNPLERVLFNEARDVNPFAVLYEALYMLAGRNDVAPLAYYTKQFNEYSDDGFTLNAAYGWRWRHSAQTGDIGGVQGKEVIDPIDQLDVIVKHLKAQPNSRRAVLSMWNVEDDLLKIGGFGNRARCRTCHGAGGQVRRNKETGEVHGRLSYNDELVTCPGCNGTGWTDEPASKDVCCNLEVMFSLRNEMWGSKLIEHPDRRLQEVDNIVRVLDMTVTNRSNDLVWGLLGANYVTFSVLQEYMAARIGCGVGRYHHFTNNLHCYDWNFKSQEWLAADKAQPLGFHVANPDDWGAQYRDWRAVPLVHDAAVFEEEVGSSSRGGSRRKTWPTTGTSRSSTTSLSP